MEGIQPLIIHGQIYPLFALMKKNKKLEPPPDAKINIAPLTPEGAVNVGFTQPMLAPKKGTYLKPKIYNAIMDV